MNKPPAQNILRSWSHHLTFHYQMPCVLIFVMEGFLLTSAIHKCLRARKIQGCKVSLLIGCRQVSLKVMAVYCKPWSSEGVSLIEDIQLNWITVKEFIHIYIQSILRKSKMFIWLIKHTTSDIRTIPRNHAVQCNILH